MKRFYEWLISPSNPFGAIIIIGIAILCINLWIAFVVRYL